MSGYTKLLIVLLILFVPVIGCGMYGVGTYNKDVRLRNGISAKQEANKPSFDTMWKILAQKTGVTTQHKDDFKEIWPDLIAGRYSQGGGKMMQWVQERNPEWDTSLYKDLMASIEAERKRFLRDQQALIDLKKEHDDLVDGFFSGMALNFFGKHGTKKVDIVIVTSSKTDSAFQDGKEDDIDLFKSKEKSKDKS
jgi:hypothetical protein